MRRYLSGVVTGLAIPAAAFYVLRSLFRQGRTGPLR